MSVWGCMCQFHLMDMVDCLVLYKQVQFVQAMLSTVNL